MTGTRRAHGGESYGSDVPGIAASVYGTWRETTDNTMSDIGVHEFCNWGGTALFDLIIINIDVGLYICMSPENYLVKLDKDKKDKCLQHCL